MPPPPLVIVAPDSFKGSLTAREAAACIAAGMRAALGDAVEIAELPLADGGEGTLDALADGWDWEIRELDVVDALDRPCRAWCAVSPDGATGIVESAAAVGLPMVADVPAEPLRADSYGAGLLVAALLDDGIEELLLCVGGTACNDAGAGLMQALGLRLLSADGVDLERGGGALVDLDRIDDSGLHPRAREVRWRVAVDVTNPLTGDQGAAAVFGPQKGATDDDVRRLAAGHARLAERLAALTGAAADDIATRPGLGAGGGLPTIPVVLLGAELQPGAELVADTTGLTDALPRAAVVITGEGRLDSQSLDGKVVDTVRRLTPDATPVVVLAGAVDLTAEQCHRAGITAALSLAAGPATGDELRAEAGRRLGDLAAHTGALLRTHLTAEGHVHINR